ncbi:hypothetical protein D3C86_1266400 [compost metagenome]
MALQPGLVGQSVLLSPVGDESHVEPGHRVLAVQFGGQNEAIEGGRVIPELHRRKAQEGLKLEVRTVHLFARLEQVALRQLVLVQTQVDLAQRLGRLVGRDRGIAPPSDELPLEALAQLERLDGLMIALGVEQQLAFQVEEIRDTRELA